MVGVDLGLESLATLSTGEKIETPRFYQRRTLYAACPSGALSTTLGTCS
jgi:hypothetical protein